MFAGLTHRLILIKRKAGIMFNTKQLDKRNWDFDETLN